MSDGLHCLYRFWSADVLLYVGITVDPGNRWRAHMGEKPWWTQVDKITLESFPTRRDALMAETIAIRHESPLYNISPGLSAILPSEMPDCCDICFDAGDNHCTYWPHRWVDGLALYECCRGHRWRCGWAAGPDDYGEDRSNRGVPR
jgi:hypothetical protein